MAAHSYVMKNSDMYGHNIVGMVLTFLGTALSFLAENWVELITLTCTIIALFWTVKNARSSWQLRKKDSKLKDLEIEKLRLEIENEKLEVEERQKQLGLASGPVSEGPETEGGIEDQT